MKIRLIYPVLLFFILARIIVSYTPKNNVITIILLLTASSLLSTIWFDYISSKANSRISNIERLKQLIIDKTSAFTFKYVVLGTELNKSIFNFLSEARAGQNPALGTYSNLLGAIIRRYFRQMLITTIIMGTPTILTLIILFQQNKLIERQNLILEFQSKLQNFNSESLKNKEFEAQVDKIITQIKLEADSAAEISKPLISKIAKLSILIQPPKIDLNTFEDFKVPISRLKAEFLIELTNNEKSYKQIGQIMLWSNFYNSDFRFERLSNKELRWLKGSFSDFSSTTLDNLNLKESILVETKYVNSWITLCDFSSSRLTNASFYDAKLYHCNFLDTNLENADFRKAIFHNCLFVSNNQDKLTLPNLNNAKVSDTLWFKYLESEFNIGVSKLTEAYYISNIKNQDYCGDYYLIKKKL